jgi:hypothetical protein
MATSSPGYGAVPLFVGAAIPAGQVLTTNGANGSSWSKPMQHTNAVQIGNPDPVITFKLNGDIVTKTGTITADDWISVIKVMKQLIMDMSQDEELASKYPYIRDAAHIWMINKLKGE